MSSENGRKTDSSDGGPAAPALAPRSDARVASAWGAARDAVAAVHNLDALLRSASVPWKTLVDLLPELRSSAGALRRSFERSNPGEAAAALAGEHGKRKVDDLEAILAAVEREPSERVQLAERAGALADELEACVDLLTLLDIAAAPAKTDVTLDVVAREVGRVSGNARGREVLVRFDEAGSDRLVQTDPYLLGPLLSLAVAAVHASSAQPLVLRARSAPQAQFVVDAAAAADASLPELRIRVMSWIAPSEATARRVAERLGATFTLELGRCVIVLPNGQRD
jgi:hypothetical protein